MNINIIQISFEIVGFSDINSNIKCNVNKIFSNYGYTLNKDQCVQFGSNINVAIQIFAENGNIKDNDMENIFPIIIEHYGDNNEKSTDDKTIVHKRCMVLNHKVTL